MNCCCCVYRGLHNIIVFARVPSTAEEASLRFCLGAGTLEGAQSHGESAEVLMSAASTYLHDRRLYVCVCTLCTIKTTYLFTYLSITYLSTYMYLPLSTYLFIYLSISIYLSPCVQLHARWKPIGSLLLPVGSSQLMASHLRI